METLLISKCLVGEKVRYDGAHCKVGTKHLEDLNSKYKLFELCPEVYAGMSVPRPPIERVGDSIVDKDGNDYTAQLEKVKTYLDEIIQSHQITKAVLKENSPTCGSKHIYDGSFSGKIIDGQGFIAEYLISKGIKVYNEYELDHLIG